MPPTAARRAPPVSPPCRGRSSSFSFLPRLSLRQRNEVRREQAEGQNGDAGRAEHAGEPNKSKNAGDHRRRAQHDADLKSRGSNFVVMILRQRDVALLLLLFGAVGKLLASFVRIRLGVVA